MVKHNYLRFMSAKEFEAYCNDEPIHCERSHRDGESPNFYFFGVETPTLKDANLEDLLGNAIYWIISGLSFDIAHRRKPSYEIAILFHGDGSLEKEEYDGGVSLCENEYKAETYNHLQWLEIYQVELTGGGRQPTCLKLTKLLYSEDVME